MNRPVRQTERRRGIDVVGPDGARVRRRRARGSHPDFRVEVLEDRSLLAATLTISSVGGALTYTASGGGSRPTISIDSSNTADVIITDLDQIITLSGAGTAGWTGSGTSTVIGPTNSYSSMAISGSTAQSQSLTIDYSASSTLDPLHVSGLAFNPAVAGSGFSNALTLMSGTGGIRFTGESYAASGAGAGTITYSDSANSNVPITFTNLAPVTDTVPSPSFLFTAPGGATTVNVVDGPASTTEINDGGTGQFELIDFANKAAATVNVNNAGATTTVDTTTASAGLTSLHVFSQAATRTIDVEATPSGVTTTTDTGSPSGGNTDVGLNGLLTSIKGPLIVQSTGGTNTLTVNDSAETVPTSYTIAGSTLVATSFPTTIVSRDRHHDLEPRQFGRSRRWTSPGSPRGRSPRSVSPAGPARREYPERHLRRRDLERRHCGDPHVRRGPTDGQLHELRDRQHHQARDRPRRHGHDHQGHRGASPEQRRRRHLHRKRPGEQEQRTSSRRSTGAT